MATCETNVIQLGNCDGDSLTDNGNCTYTFESAGGDILTFSTNSVTGVSYTAGTQTLNLAMCDGSTLSTVIDCCVDIVDNGDNTYTATFANGDIVNWDTNDIVTTLVNNGDGTYTYTNELGVAVVLDTNETVTTLTDNGNDTYTYVSEDGTSTVIDTTETITAIVDNGDRTYTYTNEAGTDFTYVTNVHQHSDESGSDYNEATLPAAPVTAPAIANANDTLREKFDNGYLNWTYNGTTWDLDFNETECCPDPTLTADAADFVNDEAPTITEVQAYVVALTTQPDAGTLVNYTSPNGGYYVWSIDEDGAATLVETPFASVDDTVTTLTDNGDNTYTYTSENATTTDIVVPQHYHHVETGTRIDTTALPVIPATVPTDLVAGDTVREEYDNGYVNWKYDGTSWSLDFYELTCCPDITHELSVADFAVDEEPTDAEVETYITGLAIEPDPGTLIKYTTPLGKYYVWSVDENGDVTQIEHHFEDAKITFYDQTGLATNAPAAPVVPTTVPTTVVAGDTVREKWLDVYRNWTWDGAAWAIDYDEPIGAGSNHYYEDESGGDYDTVTLPTAPVNPPATLVNGDTLREKFDNGYLNWSYDGTTWTLEYQETECCPDVTLVLADTDFAAEEAPTDAEVETYIDNLATAPDAGTLLAYTTSLGDYYVWSVDENGDVTLVEAPGGALADSNLTFFSQVGNDAPAAPVTPTTLPATPIAGDTVREAWDDLYRNWSFDGTNWTIEFDEPLGDADGNHSYSDQSGGDYDTVTLPTAPVAPPATPIAGDTVREKFDNGYLNWSYDGTNWTLNFEESECCPDVTLAIANTDFVAEEGPTDAEVETFVGNLATAPDAGTLINYTTPLGDYYVWSIDENGDVTLVEAPGGALADSNLTFFSQIGNDAPAAPATPTTLPATPIAGDTVREAWDDLYRNWSFDGTNWTIVFDEPLGADGRHYHTDESGGDYNETTLPTAPVTPPATLVDGDTLREKFDNGYLNWSYDGTNWTLDFEEKDCCPDVTLAPTIADFADDEGPTDAEVETYIDNLATAPDAGTLLAYTTPLGEYYVWSTDENGDVTLVEAPAGALADSNLTFFSQVGNDAPAAPVAPTTLPATPIAGDTVREQWDDLYRNWSFDGTNWTLVFDEPLGAADGNHFHADETGGDFDTVTLPTAPATPPAAAALTNGDTIRERFDNGYANWSWDGTAWTLDWFEPIGSCVCLTDVTPSAATVDVAVDGVITLTFANPIDAGTIASPNIELIDQDGVAVASTNTVAGAVVTVTPDADLTAGEQYSVYISGAVQDTDGTAACCDFATWFEVVCPEGPINVSGNGVEEVFDDFVTNTISELNLISLYSEQLGNSIASSGTLLATWNIDVPIAGAGHLLFLVIGILDDTNPTAGFPTVTAGGTYTGTGPPTLIHQQDTVTSTGGPERFAIYAFDSLVDGGTDDINIALPTIDGSDGVAIAQWYVDRTGPTVADLNIGALQSQTTPIATADMTITSPAFTGVDCPGYVFGMGRHVNYDATNDDGGAEGVEVGWFETSTGTIASAISSRNCDTCCQLGVAGGYLTANPGDFTYTSTSNLSQNTTRRGSAGAYLPVNCTSLTDVTDAGTEITLTGNNTTCEDRIVLATLQGSATFVVAPGDVVSVIPVINNVQLVNYSAQIDNSTGTGTVRHTIPINVHMTLGQIAALTSTAGIVFRYDVVADVVANEATTVTINPWEAELLLTT